MLREYREDLSAPVPLEFFSRGRIVTTDAGAAPLMLFGGDALGRDLFARFVHGARLSFGVATLGLLGALGIGALAGAWAGSAGGATERWLMRAADFVLVLPGTYLVLVMRGSLPLVLETRQIFGLMAAIFAFSAWPHVARGVRAIVAGERARPYAEAARAAGAGPFRLAAHLLPAARGFLLVEVVLLAPALLIAEVTISFLGLGFPIPAASWGMLLQDAQNVQALASAPWLLAPALGLFVVAFALHLVSGTNAESAIVTGTSASPSSSLTAPQRAR
jgi:peptide/nickel transport system permease protein